MAIIDDFFGKKTVQTNRLKRKANPTGGTEEGENSAKKCKVEEKNDAKSEMKKADMKREIKVENGGKGASWMSAEEVLKTIPDADAALLSIDPAAEKMNYFQLKAKQGTDQAAHGAKREIDTIAKGRENCLNGLTIVFTGVLPSLDREQCEQLAARYGAKVTKSISGKTSLVVIGTDAGPSKVKKIKQLKTKCIDEEGFIELISKMPSDGGSGETAVREMNRKKELERKVEEEIELEAKKEKEKETAGKTPGSGSSTFSVEKKVVDKATQLWTDKYSPTDIKQICGNKGNVASLYTWLETWFDKEHDMKGSSIDSFKAVLISGPPGIGKTTSATLISKKLGYDVIEKNASDFRSKKILNENLKVCLDNTSVNGYFTHSNTEENLIKNKKRFVLLMDEVDGMSSGDNGGVAQLAQFCKITKTPMILICNDKSLPKMRTLDKYCYDLVWRRPTAREMKSRLMSIAHREGLKLDPNLIDKLVSITHNDIRQIINIMSTVSRTQNSLNFDNLNSMQDSWEKEVSLKPFDVVAKLLSPNRLSINEKISLYFNDMDIIPLMIHENYRITKNVRGGSSKLNELRQLSKASNLISESDLVNQQIRSGEQQWSLLPYHAIMSTIYPAYEIEGQISNRINFTSWLGQNSKRMKFERIVQNLQYHTCTQTHTNNIDLRLDYVPYLRDVLVKPLANKGMEGIENVLSTMDTYYINKEDFDNILELKVNGNLKLDDEYKKIPTKVKSAFTRKYNSYMHPTVIYKTGDSIGRTSSSSLAQSEDDDGSNDNNNDDDDSDSLTKDNLIKEVKPRSVAKARSNQQTKSKAKAKTQTKTKT